MLGGETEATKTKPESDCVSLKPIKVFCWDVMGVELSGY